MDQHNGLFRYRLNRELCKYSNNLGCGAVKYTLDGHFASLVEDRPNYRMPNSCQYRIFSRFRSQKNRACEIILPNDGKSRAIH